MPFKLMLMLFSVFKQKLQAIIAIIVISEWVSWVGGRMKNGEKKLWFIAENVRFWIHINVIPMRIIALFQPLKDNPEI